ncbi:hypothetical protein J7444_07995 [Labrenzia sp. R4_1]|uniref:hypothetical protein n=1 Tax=Labrenzia sp. R4_1 TaxID=2821106 RepID=UPI001ADD43B8|nr:hypothetical protein [Labrenzia sp. R4_1]MBO9424658.1 hypothetical protein [Labrenzia sp. R4_1]
MPQTPRKHFPYIESIAFILMQAEKVQKLARLWQKIKSIPSFAGCVMEIDRLKVSRLLSAFFEKLREKDIILQVSRDFGDLEKAVRKTGKKALTEHFRRNLNTYSPVQAFWLGGYNSKGELVALAAARLDVLGSWTLADYWREYWQRCYPSAGGRPARLAKAQYRYAQEVKGDIVYLGEMWVCDEHPAEGVAALFSPAILLLSLMEWQSAGYYYAWVRPAFLERGFSYKCGFSEVHPGIRWKREPSTIDPDLWLMANTLSRLADQVDFWTASFLEE